MPPEEDNTTENKDAGQVAKEVIDDLIDPIEDALAAARGKLPSIDNDLIATAVRAFISTAEGTIASIRKALNVPDDVGGDKN